jgi:antirestriction protein ArdC
VKVEEREFTPIECCEQIVAGYKGAPEVTHGHTKAAYRPSADEVIMPSAERFHSNEEYYSTLFHEFTHSTGHKSRLARKGIVDADASFGDDKYGREELVAEMGAAFLCGHAGIEASTIDNSASYLAGWLKVIKGDPKLIVQAAGAAQKAADLILGTTWDDEATTDTPKPAKVATTKRPTKPVAVQPVAEPEPLPVAEPVAARGQLSLFA